MTPIKRPDRPFARLCLLTALVGAPGCATIFADANRDVSIVTSPVGAQILVNGDPIGSGPKKVRVSNKEPVTVVAEMPGRKSALVTIETKFNPLAYWNLINIYGWAVDLLTGSLWQLETATIVLDLPGPGPWIPPAGNFRGPTYAPPAPAPPRAATSPP